MYIPNFLPRANDVGSPNQTIIIIIATCASAGALVLTFLLLYTFRRICRRNKLAPLPPPQPLAHHREQRLAIFEERNATTSRPNTFHESASLTAPRPFGSPTPLGSNTSLLYKGSPASSIPSRHASFNRSEMEDTSLPSTPMEFGLPIPSPPRQTPSASSCSLGSSDIHSQLPPTPNSVDSSTLPHGTTSTQLNASSHSLSPSTSGSRTPRPPNRRPRPVSMTSITSTTQSWNSRNTIRGMPHGPHSQVQIMLPAPLAPDLFPYMAGEQGATTSSVATRRRSVLAEGEGLERLSVVDLWASTAVRPSSALGHENRPRSSLGEPRTSISSQSSHSAPRASRRVASSPAPRSHSTSPSPAASQNFAPSAYRPFSNSPAPPVPRVPSIYNTYTAESDAGMMMAVDGRVTERGRPRAMSVSTLNDSHQSRPSHSLRPSPLQDWHSPKPSAQLQERPSRSRLSGDTH